MPRRKTKKKAKAKAKVSSADMLASALVSTRIVDVIDIQESERQVRARCHVHNKGRWLQMLAFILREQQRMEEAEEIEWSVHLCQEYVLKPGTDRMVYTWNFILQSDDVPAGTSSICQLFSMIASNLQMFTTAEEESGQRGPEEGNVYRPSKKVREKYVEEAKRYRGKPVELEEFPLNTMARVEPEVHFASAPQVKGRRKGAHPIGG